VVFKYPSELFSTEFTLLWTTQKGVVASTEAKPDIKEAFMYPSMLPTPILSFIFDNS